MIRTQGLACNYAGAQPLRFPDVDLPQGGRLLVQGRSGSGKSTWLSLVAGLRTPSAGQVCVADGSELAAAKLERVLTNDPGTGVMRHVDAGYEYAADVARERGVRIPMWEC